MILPKTKTGKAWWVIVGLAVWIVAFEVGQTVMGLK